MKLTIKLDTGKLPDWMYSWKAWCKVALYAAGIWASIALFILIVNVMVRLTLY